MPASADWSDVAWKADDGVEIHAKPPPPTADDKPLKAQQLKLKLEAAGATPTQPPAPAPAPAPS